MITLNKLLIENFLCFSLAKFSFKEGINLICGSNGSGKSTIAKALEFGIWGGHRGLLSPKDLVNVTESQARILLWYNQAGVEKIHGWNFSVSSSPTFILDGEKQLITNQRRHLDSLIKSRDYYRQIVNVPQVKRFHLIDHWIDACEKLLGLSEDGLVFKQALNQGRKKIKNYKDELIYQNRLLARNKIILNQIETTEPEKIQSGFELSEIVSLLKDANEKKGVLLKKIDQIRFKQKENTKRIQSWRKFENQYSAIVDRLKKQKYPQSSISIIINELYEKKFVIHGRKIPLIDIDFLSELNRLSSRSEEAVEDIIQNNRHIKKRLDDNFMDLQSKHQRILSELDTATLAKNGLLKSENFCLTCNQQLLEDTKLHRSNEIETQLTKLTKLHLKSQSKLTELESERKAIKDSDILFFETLNTLKNLTGFLKGFMSQTDFAASEKGDIELKTFDRMERNLNNYLIEKRELEERIKKLEERQNELLREPSEIVLNHPTLTKEIIKIEDIISTFERKKTLLSEFIEIVTSIYIDFSSDQLQGVANEANNLLKRTKTDLEIKNINTEEITIVKNDQLRSLQHLSASELELLNFVLRLSFVLFQKTPQVLIVDEPMVYADEKTYEFVVSIVKYLSKLIPQLIIFIVPKFLEFYSMEPSYNLDKLVT